MAQFVLIMHCSAFILIFTLAIATSNSYYLPPLPPRPTDNNSPGRFEYDNNNAGQNLSVSGDLIREGPCSKENSMQIVQGYIFDIERQKCVPQNNAECPINKNLQVIPNNTSYGFCDCQENLPTVYNATTDSCHLLYSQNYCASGEWLIFTGEQSQKQEFATCVPNNCEYLRTTEFDSIALYKGKCVKLFQQRTPECDNRGPLLFRNGEAEPSCAEGPTLPAKGFGISVPPLRCGERTKWSALTMKCHTIVKFNFS